jgi:hypothetical protein
LDRWLAGERRHVWIFADEDGNLRSEAMSDGEGNPVFCPRAIAARDALIEQLPAAEVGMVGTPRTARIREDQDALGPFHEALGFGDIGAGATPFEALLTIAAQDKPAGPARDFGHGVGSEMFDNRIERSGDGRQCAKHTR